MPFDRQCAVCNEQFSSEISASLSVMLKLVSKNMSNEQFSFEFSALLDVMLRLIVIVAIQLIIAYELILK